MGPKLAPKCSYCQTGSAEKWHTVEKGVLLCGPCQERQEREQRELENELREIQGETIKQELLHESDVATVPPEELQDLHKEEDKCEEKKEPLTDDVKEEVQDERDEKESITDGKERQPPSLSPRKLRKNVRSSRKGGTGGSGGNGGKGGRSRRFIFKKNPMKAPTITVTTRTVDTLFHNNIYFQIGDIVSLMDTKDNIYYAQIKGLQIDSYCEKSAYITWLIPTTSSPPPNERFDPSTYLIGPEEELPRKLNSMDFVMHAPSSYYLDRHNPYPRPDTWGPENTTQEDNSNYIWANISHLYQC